MLTKPRGLIVPTRHNYKIQALYIKNFLDGIQELKYCIYGSVIGILSSTPNGNLRPGLSDIDIFIYHPTQDLLFPSDIIKAFAETKNGIEKSGIPIQEKFITAGKLQNNTFQPDRYYFDEVKKGFGTCSSSGFQRVIELYESTNPKVDDEHMLRHFHLKIEKSISLIPKIETILTKDKITLEDQKVLVEFWKIVKFMISIMNNAIRTKTGESLFSASSQESIERFKTEFSAEEVDTSRFLEILGKIRNIQDWYNFLKEGGIEEIIDLYNSTYTILSNKLILKP